MQKRIEIRALQAPEFMELKQRTHEQEDMAVSRGRPVDRSGRATEGAMVLKSRLFLG